MDAIVQANSHPQNPYLLHVDEINRADLAKVLGESYFYLKQTRRFQGKLISPMIFLNQSGKS